MRFASALACLAVALVLMPAGSAQARSSIRVGIGDQSPRMFASPLFRALEVRRTRHVVRSDVMRNAGERLNARAFVLAAREANVAVLLHISTTDLRAGRGRRVGTAEYKREVGRIVRYFRDLGVRDFGAWNSVNHRSQETWDSPGHAVSYFKSMYRAVKLGAGPAEACRSCGVVGLDLLDQAGAERYVDRFYERLGRTWRGRLTVIGIHNYSDVNRDRSTATARIIRAAHRHHPSARFWFTESGAVARFGQSFPYDEARQADRVENVFGFASRYRDAGVERVYASSFFGLDEPAGCASACGLDAGLVDADGTPRPAYAAFASRLRSYSR